MRLVNLIPGKKFNVPIEGWHTESGPGVYEAALEFGEVTMMADRACLFKYVGHWSANFVTI